MGPAINSNRMNVNYVMGLSRALGMNLRKDAFSDQNMKSREHINHLKEKLAFAMYKKLWDENKDVTPVNETKAESQSEGENETIDSSTNTHNTPKSKSLSVVKEGSQSVMGNETKENNFMFPPNNIIYKYFIGKGNNSIMVRSLFKNRFWWV